MKKIIIAFDGQHFSEGALRMAAWLNEKQTILVTGIFLSPIDYREVIGYSGMSVGVPIPVPPIETDDESINRNIGLFEDWCRRQGLEYRVHRDTNLFALSELITETRFADLLILSSELFYENIDKDQPNEYLRKTLHQSECPVLLVPEHYEVPRNLVLSYDGKASCVHAIKQFAYLFPELCELDTLLVTAEEENKDIPMMDYITELVSRHFPVLTIEPLVGESRQSFGNWIAARPQSLLVTGAFGRGELSSLFRQSFTTQVIRQHRVPIFITHT
jgi:nucleotide-binding universal stress UspA family protein